MTRSSPRRSAQDARRVIVYTHGGAYTMASARSRLLAMPSLANATGMRIISVDYTTAPAGHWESIQSQVLAVFQALRQEGYAEGDTAVTLRDADPILSYDLLLRNSALAYARGLDLTDPRVSPLYADFGKGFAPTLIQEGTRTIFLSTSVRLYRKLDDAGHKPLIDMYEGMPHVFQDLPVPEAATAIRRSAEFIVNRLR